MASLQLRAGSYRVLFRYKRQQYTFTLGEVSDQEAHASRANVDYLLMRVKQGLLTLPAGMDIVKFIQHGGKPPDTHREPEKRETPFSELRDSYLKTFSKGAIEENTLGTARIHLRHLGKTLGEKFPMNALTLSDLQRHIERRQKSVAGITIKKELDTLHAAWNWAERMDLVKGEYPSGRLVFPKADEKLPFMTWREIERRIAAGGDADELWECLYLTLEEIAQFLDFVKERKAPEWVFPMVLLAVHTGPRRSEMMRARLEDVDLAEGIVTIREKKRTRGVRTTRRVPLSTVLSEVLKEWVGARAGKAFLFGGGMTPMSPQTAQKAFVRVLKGSKWSVLRGWHVLRHSFISALASRGVDQRIIDSFVGHQTEEQRRRYRHLYPSTQKEAINLVFG